MVSCLLCSFHQDNLLHGGVGSGAQQDEIDTAGGLVALPVDQMVAGGQPIVYQRGQPLPGKVVDCELDPVFTLY